MTQNGVGLPESLKAIFDAASRLAGVEMDPQDLLDVYDIAEGVGAPSEDTPDIKSVEYVMTDATEDYLREHGALEEVVTSLDSAPAGDGEECTDDGVRVVLAPWRCGSRTVVQVVSFHDLDDIDEGANKELIRKALTEVL